MRASDDELMDSIAPRRWSRKWWSARLPAGAWLLGGGLVVNGMWELVARPGLGWATQAGLWVGATLSDSIANAPYARASLDAETEPQITVFQAMLMAVIFLTVCATAYAWGVFD